jgi:hypothetical protein
MTHEIGWTIFVAICIWAASAVYFAVKACE